MPFRRLLALLFFLAVLPAQAQPDTLWTRRFDGCQSASSVAETPDGHLLVLGTATWTVPRHREVVCLLKLTPDGDLVWEHNYEAGDYDAEVLPTSNGGAVIIGTRRDAKGRRRPHLHLIDARGRTVWQRTVYGEVSAQITAAVTMLNGDFALAGYAFGDTLDAYVARLNPDGILRWEQTSGQSNADASYGITVTSDDEIIAVGMKRIVRETPFDLLGSLPFTLHLSADGDVLWQGIATGGDLWTHSEDVVQNSDGDLFVAGNRYHATDPPSTAFLARANAVGHVNWSFTYPPPSPDDFEVYISYARAVEVARNGDLLFAGSTSGDGFLARIDPNGVLIWDRRVGSNESGERLTDLVISREGSYVLVGQQGYSDEEGYHNGMYVARLAADMQSSTQEASLPRSLTLLPNYPNPFHTQTTLRFALPAPAHATLQVFDALGRRVATPLDAAQPAGPGEVVFDANGLPSGIYFYRLIAGASLATGQFIVAP